MEPKQHTIKISRLPFVYEHNDNAGILYAAIDTESIEVVGTAVAEHDNRYIFVRDVKVKEEYRRQGIATKLMRAALEDIPTTCESVTLNVKRGNEAALALYKKLGFIFYSDGKDVEYLHLPTK